MKKLLICLTLIGSLAYAEETVIKEDTEAITKGEKDKYEIVVYTKAKTKDGQIVDIEALSKKVTKQQLLNAKADIEAKLAQIKAIEDAKNK